jgi:phospholipase/carboxylesterase
MTRRDFLKTGVSALAAPTLVGCISAAAPTEGDLPSSQLSARPGTPTIQPTPGLSELGLAAGRDGLLCVPENHSWDTPAPLFIGLHGAGGTAANWARYPDRAEARDMVFFAIDSRGTTWDLTPGGFGADVEFLDRALQHTFERCQIDAGHIALGGFSDGASYALSLGVSNGDLFSHLIAYLPGYILPLGSVVGKPRVFISHGNADSVLPVTVTRYDLVPSLNNADYDVTYEEFDGDHEVPGEISEMALDWFLGVTPVS